MTPRTPPTQLFIMQVQSRSDVTVRGISVWVVASDATQARTLASSRLAEAGWTVVHIDSVTETTSTIISAPAPANRPFYAPSLKAWHGVSPTSECTGIKNISL